ncbi:hypothetical protein [Marinobacterium jannaschii]|uniref:hypothetical protein n=1 Tax=Marinobacterium jannaschii TaxID=64970 RepID=UPI000483F383|nr:hypothetical protein [Marinobacterium jannaschii]
MNPRDITIDKLRRSLDGLGHKFFEAGDYNLNLIGIRSSDTDANSFNDLICLAFKQQGHWNLFAFAATTDPGVFWRMSPMNQAGTAVLVLGQHKGAFTLGQHKGYDALTQARSLPVYRDDDCDADVDVTGTIDNGWHGINLHRASPHHTSKQVDRWSAGCQVLADPDEFAMLISICDRAAREWGPKFTYTLIEEGDLA